MIHIDVIPMFCLLWVRLHVLPSFLVLFLVFNLFMISGFAVRAFGCQAIQLGSMQPIVCSICSFHKWIKFPITQTIKTLSLKKEIILSNMVHLTYINQDQDMTQGLKSVYRSTHKLSVNKIFILVTRFEFTFL